MVLVDSWWASWWTLGGLLGGPLGGLLGGLLVDLLVDFLVWFWHILQACCMHIILIYIRSKLWNIDLMDSKTFILNPIQYLSQILQKRVFSKAKIKNKRHRYV